MSILTVELPDEAMESLQRAARERGQEVEVFVREWAQSVSETPENDPFWKAAGSIQGDFSPDFAANHDFYLAEEAINTHADKNAGK